MKKLTCILLTVMAFFCLATATAEEVSEQWILYFKMPQARVEKVSKDHYQLTLYQLPKAEAYMLNDRPFYLIRRLDSLHTHFWQDMAKFRASKKPGAKATLFYGGGSHEVILSNFKLHGSQATYQVKPTTIEPVSEMSSGELQFFVLSHSKPLCNLINEQRHAMKLLNLQQ